MWNVLQALKGNILWKRKQFTLQQFVFELKEAFEFETNSTTLQEKIRGEDGKVLRFNGKIYPMTMIFNLKLYFWPKMKGHLKCLMKNQNLFHCLFQTESKK